MIKKKRLEELFEQGATIYSLDTKLYGCVKYLELKCASQKPTYNVLDEVRLTITDNGWWHWFSLKDLYESKEDVEEILEFGNITRTERLELPSWEEFNKVSTFAFKRKDGTDMEIAIWHNCPDDDCKTIKITRSYDWSACCFEKPLTRENYNEARRLCVKLFKGEEV